MGIEAEERLRKHDRVWAVLERPEGLTTSSKQMVSFTCYEVMYIPSHNAPLVPIPDLGLRGNRRPRHRVCSRSSAGSAGSATGSSVGSATLAKEALRLRVAPGRARGAAPCLAFDTWVRFVSTVWVEMMVEFQNLLLLLSAPPYEM